MPDDAAPSRAAETWFSVRLGAWRARRLLAVLVAVVVIGAGVRLLSPAPPRTVPVVVAGRALEIGTALTAGDLDVVHQPVALVPAGTVSDPAALVGRVPVVALPAGMPLVDTLLGGDRFDVEPPAGSVVVPVRLADPAVAGLLRAGDLIDLVTAGTDSAPAPGVVARRALVIQSAEPRGDPLGLGGEQVVLTVVAVSPEEGRRLAAATSWGAVAAVLVG